MVSFMFATLKTLLKISAGDSPVESGVVRAFLMAPMLFRARV